MTLLSRVPRSCASVPGLLSLFSLALLPCVGGCLEGDYGVTPYVHNLARATLTVRVRELQGAPTCALLDAQVAHFTDDDFAPAVRYDLGSGELLPLVDPLEETRVCGAVHVRIGDDFDRVISWHGAALELVPEFPDAHGPTSAQALQVIGVPARFLVKVGDSLGTTPLSRREVRSHCDVPRAPSIAWSGFTHGVDVVIDRVRPTSDGCLLIDDGTRSAFVCVPESMFPFAAGDRLTVVEPATSAAALEEPRLDLAVSGVALRGQSLELSSDSHTLELRRNIGQWPTFDLGSGPLEPAACAPVRDGCGSWLLPARAPIAGELLEAGQMRSARTLEGARVQVYVGRVEQVTLSASGCGWQGPEGVRVDLALLRSFERLGGDDGTLEPAQDEDAGIDAMDEDAGVGSGDGSGEGS